MMEWLFQMKFTYFVYNSKKKRMQLSTEAVATRNCRQSGLELYGRQLIAKILRLAINIFFAGCCSGLTSVSYLCDLFLRGDVLAAILPGIIML